MNTPDTVTRLNAALDGRYRIEREIGEARHAVRREEFSWTGSQYRCHVRYVWRLRS